MHILALDASTNACSVALLCGSENTHRFEIAERAHTQLVLPMIKEVLAQASLSTQQLDAIAFTAGPGSFTGIRIAMSVAQGLACAHDLPLISLSSLAVLAQGASREHGVDRVLATLDARREQLYWGEYAVLASDGCVVNATTDQLSSLAQLPKSFASATIITGSGVTAYRAQMEAHFVTRGVICPDPQFPSALHALPLAARDFAVGEIIDVTQAEAIYFRQGI